MTSKKSLKYFNGTTILASFTELFVQPAAFAVFPKRDALYLNDCCTCRKWCTVFKSNHYLQLL